MKISEKWLRSFVKIDRPIQEIAEILTMRGLEVEEIAPVSSALNNIVVAEILSAEQHPNADRLRVCQVNDGAETFTIVCGAPNARAGVKVVLAKIGAILPGVTIKKSKIRDVESHGMLCSVSELGLAEKSEGIMELPEDAPVGTALMEYLELDDNILDISITPNRGDCVSVLGIAREVAAIEGGALLRGRPTCSHYANNEVFALQIKNHDPVACPIYLARIIRGINPKIATPIWLKEKLRRSGIRSIALPVDVTNYVMLELGQPMHAFDLQHIIGDLEIRHARLDERVTLLNEVSVALDDSTLVIADEQGPVALAGIMGGLRGAVSVNTCDIILECAHFSPKLIGNTVRQYNLHSDSSYRFERGVDPELPLRAMELATQMIVDIAGGVASVVKDLVTNHSVQSTILLRFSKLEKVIGSVISPSAIKNCFSALAMHYVEVPDGLMVTVPSYRFDLKIEEDLIEEVLRIHGCDAVEAIAPSPLLSLQSPLTSMVNIDSECLVLKTLGYDEIISYSFVDEKLQTQLVPNQKAIKLLNPISQDMSVMRTTLWTGLLTTLLYNLRRQQSRVRLFEQGLCFFEDGAQLKKLSGLIYGSVYPETWDSSKEIGQFFNVKNDVIALLAENGVVDSYEFVRSKNPALHPTQSAQLVHKQTRAVLGDIGVLHPQLVQSLDLLMPPVLFELDVQVLRQVRICREFSPLSKFPEVRRDLSFLIPTDVPYADVHGEILNSDKSDRIRRVTIFDVYQGKGVPEGQKSIAIALIIQNSLKTLMDDEVATLVKKVIDLVESKFKATLRD